MDDGDEEAEVEVSTGSGGGGDDKSRVSEEYVIEHLCLVSYHKIFIFYTIAP